MGVFEVCSKGITQFSHLRCISANNKLTTATFSFDILAKSIPTLGQPRIPPTPTFENNNNNNKKHLLGYTKSLIHGDRDTQP